jgi:WD40 repeat protein
LQLVAGGRLCVMVACKLLRVPGQQAIRPLVRHGTAILSRRHQFDDEATCVATVAGHSDYVFSVAFHATEPLLATGSWDNSAKVWRMSADGTAATCVATLAGHSDIVTSVAFHAREPMTLDFTTLQRIVEWHETFQVNSPNAGNARARIAKTSGNKTNKRSLIYITINRSHRGSLNSCSGNRLLKSIRARIRFAFKLLLDEAFTLDERLRQNGVGLGLGADKHLGLCLQFI